MAQKLDPGQTVDGGPVPLIEEPVLVAQVLQFYPLEAFLVPVDVRDGAGPGDRLKPWMERLDKGTVEAGVVGNDQGRPESSCATCSRSMAWRLIKEV